MRDAIHGMIQIRSQEMEIIDTPAFQRLRHIRQLATTYLVYPSAEHTRFGHSIGTMHIASRIIQNLRQKKPDCFYKSTTETVVNTYLGKDLLRNDQHILNFLMDSELDCDKMDYLLRDSHYCGVNYGHYDLERLLSAIDIGAAFDDETVKVIAVHEDGLHAFEEFVLARYFMFLQVYFHKTRRILDMSLQRYLKKALRNGHYPKDTKKYLEWNDDRVLQSMAKHGDMEEVRHFTERRFPRLVYQTNAHVDDKIGKNMCG